MEDSGKLMEFADRIIPGSHSEPSVASRTESNPAHAVIIVFEHVGVRESRFVQSAIGDSLIQVENTPTNQFSVNHIRIDGQLIVLVDTIGFDDTRQGDDAVLQEIATWLAKKYGESTNLVKVLCVRHIRSPLFTASAMNSLQMFMTLIGDVTLSSVVLLATQWHGVNVGGEEKIREALESDHMGSFMFPKGSTIERFSGTTKDAHRVLRSVLKQNSKVILNIQRELIDRQMDLSDTETMTTSREEADKFRSNQLHETNELQVVINQALETERAKLPS